MKGRILVATAALALSALVATCCPAVRLPEPTPPLPTAIPTAAKPGSEETPPGARICEMIAERDVTAYQRPSERAEVFATVPAGYETIAEMQTADGWVGFDPGIAQAANIGVFRMRWVKVGPGVRLEGACEGLPVVEGPPPGVCLAVALMETDIYARFDEGSKVLGTMQPGDYVKAIGWGEDRWLQVDASVGNLGAAWIGWVEIEAVNLNGPCEGLPNQ